MILQSTKSDRRGLSKRAVTARFFILFLILSISSPLNAGETLDSLREKAANGDGNAMFALGSEYFYGSEATPVNYTLAAHWYRMASGKNIPQALFNYGICLERGLGTAADPFAAYDCYKKAAEKGYAPARYNVAMTLLSGIPEDKKRSIPALKPSRELALYYLEDLAKEHFIPAETVYAELMLERRDDPACVAKAVAVLERLAALEKPPAAALRMMADCKYAGTGMKRDLPGMIRLLEQAEKNGDAEAAGKLAYCYEFGRGVTPDEKRAFELYKKGAVKGNAMSMFKYAEYLASGKMNGGTPAIADAVEWYRKSAEAGSVQATFKLGVFCLEGIGMKKNEREAAKLFYFAAKNGYPPAQYNIGCMFAKGQGGLAADDTAASFWFLQAAKHGDPAAARTIALRYFEGRGVPRSVTNGEYWLKTAADAGDHEALRLLAGRAYLQ